MPVYQGRNVVPLHLDTNDKPLLQRLGVCFVW